VYRLRSTISTATDRQDPVHFRSLSLSLSDITPWITYISNISSRSKSSPPSSSVLGSEAYNCVVIIGVDVIDLDEGTTEKADVPGVMEIPRTRTERTASKKLDVILQLLFFAVVVLVVVVVVVRLEHLPFRLFLRPDR